MAGLLGIRSRICCAAHVATLTAAISGDVSTLKQAVNVSAAHVVPQPKALV